MSADETTSMMLTIMLKHQKDKNLGEINVKLDAAVTTGDKLGQ